MSVVETINKISTTIDDLLNFVANNNAVSSDFEKFLEINNIEIKTDEQLNRVILDYILEGEMQNNTRVVDFYTKENKKADKKLLAALRDSYYSIFHIKKIHKNSYQTYCLTNEKEFELIPLVKTTTLRSIGLKDYIVGRIIEYKEEYYLLEIDDVISSNDGTFAQAQGVRYLVKNPEKIYWHNSEKLEEFKEIVNVMTKSFKMGLGYPAVITVNKLADDLLEYFNKYHHNLLEGETLEPLIKNPEKWGYFDVQEFKDIETINDEYLDNAAGGFSTHNCVYDVGFWVDDELGIFIIPFLGTFFEIVKVKTPAARDVISNWQQCISDFIYSPKVPPSVLLKAGKNLVKIVNIVFESNFETVEQIIEKFKHQYLTAAKFSPTIVLYNSSVFYELLEYLQNKPQQNEQQTVGRNEPCPCGSGKKYKKCCLK